MKLSFSTNGWKLPFTDFIRLAEENGIGAVEIHSPNASFGNVNPFAKENVNDTVRLLRENSLCISALDAPENLAAKVFCDGDVLRLKEEIAYISQEKKEKPLRTKQNHRLLQTARKDVEFAQEFILLHLKNRTQL